MTPVAIALGSNLGDREHLLREAIAALAPSILDERASSFHETEAVGGGNQPPFLNAAVTGRTTLTARVLLGTLLDIEYRFGRQRPYPGAPRTLDLDLILYGELIVEEPHLTIPHPRFRERVFVLEPLAEIAAEWVDPGTGRTVGELLEILRTTRRG